MEYFLFLLRKEEIHLDTWLLYQYNILLLLQQSYKGLKRTSCKQNKQLFE